MKRAWWGGVVMVAVGLSIGCPTEDSDEPSDVSLDQAQAVLGRHYCERMFACDCQAGRRYYDIDACYGDVERWVADVASRNQTYDPSCMGRFVAQLDAMGCDVEAEPIEHCDLLSGQQVEGEPCMKNFLWSSECGVGLVCNHQYVCVPEDSEAAAPPNEGQPCSNEHPCAEGLSCNRFDNVCETPAAVGEACNPRECEDGSFCDNEDLQDPTTPLQCHALRANGQECYGHPQCASGHCPNGFCAPAVAEGEPCPETRVCGTGLACIEDVCRTTSAALCGVLLPRY